jgi:hypothetical protein
MHDDQTTVAKQVDERGNPDAFTALEGINTRLRHAVEDRNYARVEELIAEQRDVFERASPYDPEIIPHAERARDLIIWALTMVRLQRAHDQRAISELGAFRQAYASYRPEPIRTFDRHAEG